MSHEKSRLVDAAKTCVWGLLWLLGACWFFYSVVGNPIDELTLILRAETAPGFVIDAWEDMEAGDRVTHWTHAATYKYELPDGRQFTGHTRQKSGRLKDALRNPLAPYPVEVEYLPHNPEVSRIKGDGSGSLIDFLWRKVGLGLVLLLVFASPGIMLLRKGFCDMKRANIASRADRH